MEVSNNLRKEINFIKPCANFTFSTILFRKIEN